MNDILDQIIENFEQQHQLYSGMYGLAQLQLDILQGKVPLSGSERIQELLSQRQDILVSIMLLNEDNKQYQAQAVKELGLKRFVLSELQECMVEGQFKLLQTRIANLGGLLEDINTVDKQNQRVMELGTPGSSGRAVEKISSNDAQKAYRNAMDSKKKKV